MRRYIAAIAVACIVAAAACGGSPSGSPDTTPNPDATAPGPVDNVRVSQDGNRNVISWDPVTNPVQGYEVTRKVANTSSIEMVGLPQQPPIVDELSARPELLDKELIYSVRAIGMNGVKGPETNGLAVPVEVTDTCRNQCTPGREICVEGVCQRDPALDVPPPEVPDDPRYPWMNRVFTCDNINNVQPEYNNPCKIRGPNLVCEHFSWISLDDPTLHIHVETQSFEIIDEVNHFICQ